MSQMKQKIIDKIEQETDDFFEDMYGVMDDPFDEMLNDKKFVAENTCDCGAFKTHGAIDPEYHSNWCKLNDGN